ncbi:uncharacterized protein LOC128202672 [Mya arenaria]|uniref:uncharacterized protein LOC128202672 n=1 Tax=Mya arenaria TaxID=6604 RepID=UPI0022E6AA2A|nr:uncharacterized protein LOC128202672 [Mya arenaria]
MQSAKAKKSSFKCPSFTAPIKSGDNSTAEQDGKKKQQTASSRDKADKDLESSNARNTSTVLLESKTEAGLDHKPSAKGDGSQSDEVDADKEETQEEELKNEDEEAQVVPHQSGPDEHGDKEQNNVQTKKSVEKVMKKKKTLFNVQQTEPEQKETKGKTLNAKETTKKVLKPQKEVMPVRSLTDEEYTAIFDAVLESGETFNIDEWEPKVTPPIKVREPLKKKFSITVGKKPKQPEEAKADELDDKPLTENKDEESSTTDKPEKNKDVKEKKKKNKQVEKKITKPDDAKNKQDDIKDSCDEDENNNKVEETENKEIDESHDFDDEQEKVETEGDEVKAEVDASKDDDDDDADDAESVRSGQDAEVEEQIDEEIRPSGVQRENETTPPGSEADPAEAFVGLAASPSKKKKKIKKRDKLEPKKLPFQEKQAAPASMVDQIKQMKKEKALKKKHKHTEEHTVPIKKAKLDSKAHTKPTKTSTITPVKKVNKRKKMIERELEHNGTWVQCCNSSCMKWRHLSDVNDPAMVPDRWTCSMNKCEKYNSCSKPEEEYDENEHIYTKFTEGSVVWAKMMGYPWWPAMVEIDPNSETFFSVESEDSMIPTHFHVVFFDERVSRGWVKAQHIMLLAGDEKEDKVIMTPKRYAKDVAAAKKNALHALKCDLKERIELFGFAARFKGIWEHKPVKVKEPGRSKKKAMSTTSKDQFNELLDETTMDEVLDNADSILDNVEDMLDSIDSDFIDSDEEASFVPHELVVVETKRKHKGRVVKDTKRVKIVSPPSTQEHEEEENQKTDNSDIEINNKLDAVTSKTDKFPTTRVNFDKEIFTMEMSEASDIDEIVLAVEETENQTGNKITKETNIKITKKEKKEVNKFKTDAKAKENQKNADTKESLEKNDSDIDVKAKEKHEEIKAVALQEQNVELTEKECNSVPEAEKQDEKPNQVKSFDDSCVNVEADSDDEMDLFDNIDNKVEKQEEPIENSETEARHEVNQSLEGSDIELSLEEHSLYDDVIAGDAKVRGRENIYAPREVSNEVPAVGMDGEDSDPFDLMEE